MAQAETLCNIQEDKLLQEAAAFAEEFKNGKEHDASVALPRGASTSWPLLLVSMLLKYLSYSH